MSAFDSKPEAVGHWLGRIGARIVQLDVRAMSWIVMGGASRRVAALVLWMLKSAVFVILLYAAFWMALLFAIVLMIAAGARHGNADEQPKKWLKKDPDDHREDLFYDPLSYNDDPDPRFSDPRHDGK